MRDMGYVFVYEDRLVLDSLQRNIERHYLEMKLLGAFYTV